MPAATLGQQDAAAWALAEFGQAQLGDTRRTKRAVQVAASLVRQPTSSIPKVHDDWSQTKGAYRLISNKQINHEALMSGHTTRTVERASNHAAILLLEDGSSFSFSGKKRHGLGPVNDSPHSQGLHVHTVLAVSKGTHEVLGVLDQQLWVRSSQKKPKKESVSQRKKRNRESLVWVRSTERALNAFAKHSPLGPRPKLISVGDRENDIYEALLEKDRLGMGYVIRAKCNRLLDDDDEAGASSEPKRRYLLEEVRTAPIVATTEVEVPARPGRAARTAPLEVRAMEATVCPPKNLDRKGHSLALNIVLAIEPNPPAGVEPLVWYLLTREPIATAEDVLAVVGIYQARWLIEEFHMGFKSGCHSEQRQFETAHAIKNFLAFAAVIAWHLLALRDLARRPEPIPASHVLSPTLLAVLAALRPRLPDQPTARQALRTIATLGGFLARKGDGEPGWRTLWRGFERLLASEAGYLAAKRSG